MAEKFFFRNENLGNDPDSFMDVPEDLMWAVEQGVQKPMARSSGVPQSGDGLGVSGPMGDGQGYDAVYSYPNTKIGTPVIRGIVKQEVSQDPEGKGTIDVTFAVDDLPQGSVEWEVRVTR